MSSNYERRSNNKAYNMEINVDLNVDVYICRLLVFMIVISGKFYSYPKMTVRSTSALKILPIRRPEQSRDRA